ncbi:SDR family NAD(P)-dependent oxidoreductase [Gordonia zhaorongruii]|uniref:SDR family NAD(P)-dependent oxidoreductase n=1 Tax=Gordonia zhaorongruii TaxID=2597659 RepID=UPI00117F1893|nr:SDR family oxidoreductase [Gordonia zhaorongruii]
MADSRLALVTGGSGGIGSGIVRRLVDDGLRVVFTYHHAAESAESLVDECAQRGGTATAIRMDLADTDSLPDALTRIENDHGPIDVLVHAAAHVAFGSMTSLAERRYDEYLASFAVNTHALTLLLARCSSTMRDDGRIVNISSLNSSLGLFGSAAYSGSKAATEAIIRTASRELGSRGITCNTVQLGLVDTETMHAAVNDAAVDWVTVQTPTGRIGEPADVASLVSHLASGEAGWITGQTIRLDGGYHL